MTSINDASPSDWDKLKEDRFFDNRDFPKDTVPECTLIKPVPPPTGQFDWDMVKRPKHYTVGPTEVIDIIRQQQGSAVEFHYEAALLKYILRWRYKNGIEDLEKAKVYLGWLIQQKKSEQGG